MSAQVRKEDTEKNCWACQRWTGMEAKKDLRAGTTMNIGVDFGDAQETTRQENIQKVQGGQAKDEME